MPANETATFLAQALPWPDSAHAGYVNIHSLFVRPGTTQIIMPGQAFTHVNDALYNVAWRVRKNNDVYVCMSLQQDARPLKRGQRSAGAIRDGRTAVAFKGFWLDVDLKDGFADDVDLLTRFGIWRKTVGLPIPSFAIFTGGGYHFHWVLDALIAPALWHPVAQSLAEACRRENFRADHKCTIDAARVLRIPGTYNQKYSPPREVRIVHIEGLVTYAEMEGPLKPYKTAYRAPASPASSARSWSLPPGSRPAAAFGGQVLGPSLDGGIDLGLPTAADVAVECPWFMEIVATDGAGTREPEWFDSLKVAYFCKDPRATAHAISSGHPDYSVHATDEKYATTSKSAEAFGWPQCASIQSSGATQCAACPHLSKGKSPLNFVGLTAASPTPPPSSLPPPSLTPATPGLTAGPIPGTSQIAPAITFMPTDYRYNADGFIEHFRMGEDRKGKVWEQIYPVRVNGFVRQQKNEEVRFGRELLHFQFEDVKGPRHAQIYMAAVHDARMFKSVLSEQGMSFKDSEAQQMGRFMVSFVQQLRAAPHLSIECEPYGWSMKDGVEDAFTYDGTRFNCNGNRQVAPSDIGLGDKFKATGSFAIWQQAALMITDQQRPDLNTILAAGLGAPLVQMTGHNGFVISAYSTATGVQKSAAMRVSQAIWGNPVSGMAGLDDTNNFLNTRLGMLRHLPLFVDELKFADEFRRAETLVLGITQGKTKGRLDRSSQTMETLTFNTMMITASNASLVDHISEHSKTTTAGMARIFEFVVERGNGTGMIDTNKAQGVIGQLEHNHGGAGRIYAEFLGQNVPRVRADVQNMCATINDVVKGTTDERFWVAAIAVLIVGAQYGNELGLTNIDIGQLIRFLLEQFRKQRRATEVSTSNIGAAGTVERYVADFVNGHPQQTIKTDIVDTAPGRSTLRPVVLNDVNSIMGLSRGVCIHAVRDMKLVRISIADFGKWLAKEHRISKHAVIKKVKELLPAKEIKASIGRGTIYKRTPEPVLEFDVAMMPGIDLFN